MPDLTIRTVEAARRAVRVSVVGRVVSYDGATQSCTAVPVVREVQVTAGEWIPVPVVEIEGVPVVWAGGSLRGMTAGLEEGDEVILLVRTQSHDEVDGGQAPDGEDEATTPRLRRRLDLSDSIALPGYVRPGDGQDSGHFDSSGKLVLYFPNGEDMLVGDSTAAEALALASLVDARVDTLQGKIDDILTELPTHTHVGVTTGPGATGVAVFSTLPIGQLASVACDDIKVRS